MFMIAVFQHTLSLHGLTTRCTLLVYYGNIKFCYNKKKLRNKTFEAVNRQNCTRSSQLFILCRVLPSLFWIKAIIDYLFSGSRRNLIRQDPKYE